MPALKSFDGLSLFYAAEEGRGRPVLLLHGFAADTNINWVRSGVFDALADEGFRVVALDARGHGLSDKPHEAEAYAGNAAARDVQALLDELGGEGWAVVGYSMGARTAAEVAAVDPRVSVVALLGVGEALLQARPSLPLAEALLADDPATVADERARELRRLADSVGGDRVALAALVSASAGAGAGDLAGTLEQLAVPVLVVGGADDAMAGPPEGLAARIAGATAVTVPGDHFNLLAQPQLHRALIELLRPS